ncbi:MAG: transposase [Acidobacteriota bacterium]
MNLVRKIRLEVDPLTESILDSQSKIANWLYNHLLEEAEKLRSQYISTLDSQTALTLYSQRGLRDEIPELKKQYRFLKTVYSSALKNAALRLSSSIREYQNSRKGKRKGKGVNWPRYRSWKRKRFSLQYDEPWKGYQLSRRSLKLQLGVDEKGHRLSVECKLVESLASSDLEAVKQLRIVKQAGEFFAVFTLENKEIEKKEISTLRIITLDPNHKNLAYAVATDGRAIEIEILAKLKSLDQRIDLLKSRRDKCKKQSRLIEYKREDGSIHRHYKASRRWLFFNRLLEQAYRERREQTKTFLYTLANKLSKEYDVIGIGDYTPQGVGITTAMRRAINNRSLIGRFKEVLEWVAVKSGKVYLEYEERGTTRTCHIPGCQYQVKGGLAPDIREWICPNCKTLHIRDENAAQNGMVRVLEKLKMPRSGHTPVSIQARWAWQVTPSGVQELRGGVAVSTAA